MKVSEAIKMLEGMRGDEEIVFAFWCHDLFPYFTEEQWGQFTKLINWDFDWSLTYEAMMADWECYENNRQN